MADTSSAVTGGPGAPPSGACAPGAPVGEPDVEVGVVPNVLVIGSSTSSSLVGTVTGAVVGTVTLTGGKVGGSGVLCKGATLKAAVISPDTMLHGIPIHRPRGRTG